MEHQNAATMSINNTIKVGGARLVEQCTLPTTMTNTPSR